MCSHALIFAEVGTLFGTDTCASKHGIRARILWLVGCVDEIANLAADGSLPIGQGIDVGVSTRVGSVGHAGSTVT
jgi:hypothetical protein